MFGNNNKKDSISSPVSNTTISPSSSINALGGGTKIEGNIHADGDIRIDGNLIGSLDCKGKVIVGPQGIIDGTLTCKNAVVEGVVKGKINVHNELSIRETAKVTGEVNTGQLMVQPGAVFNVSCGMGAQSQKTKLATLDKAVAS